MAEELYKKLQQENKKLKLELAMYKKAFMFQDKVLTSIEIPKQEKILVESIANQMTNLLTDHWLEYFPPLENLIQETVNLLSLLEIDKMIHIQDILALQKEIEVKVKKKEWSDKDTEYLKASIVTLSLIFSSVQQKS